MGKHSAFYAQLSELGESLGYDSVDIVRKNTAKVLYQIWDKEKPILLSDEEGLHKILEALQAYKYCLERARDDVVEMIGIFHVLMDGIYLKDMGEEPDV